MSEEPRRRPILKLKNPPKVVIPGAPAPPVPPSAPPKPDWKCKPCGTGFSVDPELADDAAVRCPACNARLGLAAEFRMDPTPARVRARRVKR